MRASRCLVAIAATFLLPATARPDALAYVFAAPGGVSGSGSTSASTHFGAGAEGIFKRYFGVGAEVGYLFENSGGFQNGFGVLSPNGYFHPRGRAALDPYVTGGYTLFFRNGHANLGNFGFGVNWWFRNHLGAKVEFRDHVYSSGGTAHFWGVKLGLCFR